MNRTALCIRMLQLLKVRGRMKISELADVLETNPRNIPEFRKELEIAGYAITQTRGRYGGYELKEEVLLPSLAFSEEEEQALQEARGYLRSHPDFLHLDAFASALDKLLANDKKEVTSSGIYVFPQAPDISDQEQKYVKRCQQAISHRLCAKITYQPLSDAKPYTILIHPYELLYYQGACYCLAYSLKAHDYRLFRFSDQRMYDFEIQDRSFSRDPGFALEKYIGENGLIKGHLIFARLLVKGAKARTLAEQSIGVSCHKYWQDDQTLLVETWMESDYALMELVLKLGKDVELLAPDEMRERIIQECKRMLARYITVDRSML